MVHPSVVSVESSLASDDAPLSYPSSEAHQPPKPVTADDLIRAARGAGCSTHTLAAAIGRADDIMRDHFESVVSDSFYDITNDAADAARAILLDGASDAVREAVEAEDAAHRVDDVEPVTDGRDPFAAEQPF